MGVLVLILIFVGTFVCGSGSGFASSLWAGGFDSGSGLRARGFGYGLWAGGCGSGSGLRTRGFGFDLSSGPGSGLLSLFEKTICLAFLL